MDLDKVIDAVTPEVYSSLKKSIELGKWENGVKLTKEQLANSMQIVIAYDARHKVEKDRVGYVAPKEHTQCDSLDGSGPTDEQEWQTVSIKE